MNNVPKQIELGDLKCIVLPWDIREDRDRILEILKPFLSSGRKYAVRSSANLEDSAAVSFAGGFNTELNVDPGDVLEAVQNCFTSISGRNIDEYIEKTCSDKSALQMNVVVQEMVMSDISGIIFTANPMGLLSESVITVGRGLGDLVVEDRTDTTTYYYNLTDTTTAYCFNFSISFCRTAFSSNNCCLFLVTVYLDNSTNN